MEEISCPVCGTPNTKMELDPRGTRNQVYRCLHCGNFMLTLELVDYLAELRRRDPDAGYKLSHAIQQAQRSDRTPVFKTYDADAIITRPLPRPREQADLLVRWLAENSSGPGEHIWIGYKSHGAIIGAKSDAGFMLIVKHLAAEGLLIQESEAANKVAAQVTLSLPGWDYYETLRQGIAKHRRAFMAMEYDDSELEKVFENILKPGAERAGFTLQTLRDNPKAGLIDNRLRVEIQSADFVVADLTHKNAGAYWEAGYAEGLGKPVIYTCEKHRFEQNGTHFDTNHHQTIIWDPASLENAGKELTATIRATFPHLAKFDVDDEDSRGT